MHLAQRPRKSRARTREGQLANLIAAHPSRRIWRQGAMPCKLQIVFGAGDKESTRRRQPAEPLKIHIATIYDVKSPRLKDQLVEPENVVLTGVGTTSRTDRWSSSPTRKHPPKLFTSGEAHPRVGARRRW